MKILKKIFKLAIITSIVIFAAFKTEGFADDVPQTTEVSDDEFSVKIDPSVQEKQAGGGEWLYYFRVHHNEKYHFEKIRYKSPDQQDEISGDSELVTNQYHSGGNGDKWQYTKLILPSSRDVYTAWNLTVTEENPEGGTYTVIFCKFFLDHSGNEDDNNKEYKTHVYLKPQKDDAGNYLDVYGNILDITIEENIDKIALFMYSLDMEKD